MLPGYVQREFEDYLLRLLLVDASSRVSIGHLVRIRDSDSNSRFQIAAVSTSGQIGKFRHLAAVALDSIKCRKRPGADAQVLVCDNIC